MNIATAKIAGGRVIAGRYARRVAVSLALAARAGLMMVLFDLCLPPHHKPPIRPQVHFRSSRPRAAMTLFSVKCMLADFANLSHSIGPPRRIDVVSKIMIGTVHWIDSRVSLHCHFLGNF